MSTPKDTPASMDSKVDWGSILMDKAYEEYIEEWRSGYGSGAEACAYIAEAFARCPDLLSIRAYRDVDNDQVDITPVWAKAADACSTDADRSLAKHDLARAGFTLTQCHEFHMYEQAPRPAGNPLHNQALIASSLKLRQAHAYLEAMDLRATIMIQTQTALAFVASKHRL